MCVRRAREQILNSTSADWTESLRKFYAAQSVKPDMGIIDTPASFSRLDVKYNHWNFSGNDEFIIGNSGQ